MKKCLICSEKINYSIALKLGEYKYLVCDNCNGGVLFPRKKALNEIKKVYDTKYFNWKKESGFKKFLFNRRFFKPYPDWIEHYKYSKGKIADVGAGIPTFVKEMKNRGWDSYAIELSKEQANKIKRILGKNKVFVGDFEKVKLPNKYFDALTFWHVFEHVLYPQKTIIKSKYILKNNGIIFIEVPNFKSFNLWLFREKYSLISIPAHLFYYSEKSLRMIFTMNGFKVIKVSYPLKYNSVFSASLVNQLSENISSKSITNVLFYLFLPISLVLNMSLSLFGRSDILRIVVEKKN